MIKCIFVVNVQKSILAKRRYQGSLGITCKDIPEQGRSPELQCDYLFSIPASVSLYFYDSYVVLRHNNHILTYNRLRSRTGSHQVYIILKM
jgi:hypothetical protein